MATRGRLSWGLAPRLLATGLGLAAAGAAQAPPAEELLATIPVPALDPFEPAVRHELAGLRAELAARLARERPVGPDLGRALGALGETYLNYDLVLPAAAALELAARLDPQEFRWWYLLAVLQAGEGRALDAADSLERALVLRPEDVPALVRRARVALQLGDAELAATALARADRLGPGAPAVLFELGRLAALRGDWEGARRQFSRVLELQPEATAVHHSLAMACRELGDIECARAELAHYGPRQVRLDDPIYDSLQLRIVGGRIHFFRAREALTAGRHEEALRELEQAAVESPTDAAVFDALASVLAGAGRAREAETAWRRALEIDPDSTAAHFNLGTLLADAGRLEEAAEHFAAAARIDPQDREARAQWAAILARLGRSGEVMAALREPAPQGSPVSGLRFTERAAAWGLDFRHHHGGSGERYMVETMCGGVAILDFDADGDWDVFFVDGGALPGYQGTPARSRLLRNDAGRFVDWTDRTGLAVADYGCGATAGDVEGDGDVDLYVTAFGSDQLFRNAGDGTFADATAAAGLGDTQWSTASAFADVDRDGDLDLYVGNYLDFSLERHKTCREPNTGLVMYCHPEAYHGVPDRFFENRGDGTFDEASAAAGLAGDTAGAALGVLFADFDRDGWPDLYVANDTQPNYLFRNRGDGTFEDRSFLSGTAVGERGKPEAGMGVDAGDVDGDGLVDIVVTNFERETNALYRNLDGSVFVDSRYPMGIAQASFRMLGFGVDFADFDQDADLDLIVANGHVSDNAAELSPNSRYAQRNQLFENLGGRFRELAETGLDVVRPSRGMATGDLDGDGDLDCVIVNSNDVAEAYENLGGGGGAWLLVDLAAEASAPGGVGAHLTVVAGGVSQVGEVRTASSYLSQNALSAHFGLGGAATIDSLTVAWPSGRRLRFEGLPGRRRLRVRE